MSEDRKNKPASERYMIIRRQKSDRRVASGAALRRAQARHSGTISASEGGILLSRASPMPTS